MTLHVNKAQHPHSLYVTGFPNQFDEVGDEFIEIKQFAVFFLPQIYFFGQILFGTNYTFITFTALFLIKQGKSFQKRAMPLKKGKMVTLERMSNYNCFSGNYFIYSVHGEKLIIL